MNSFRSVLAALCILGLAAVTGCRHTTKIFVDPFSNGLVSKRGDVLTWHPLSTTTPEFRIYVKVGVCEEGMGPDAKDTDEPGDTERLMGASKNEANAP